MKLEFRKLQSKSNIPHSIKMGDIFEQQWIGIG
jgi:hypothetical protein